MSRDRRRRPPYRSRDRLGFVGTMSLGMFGAILGAALYGSGHAHADPGLDTSAMIYAARNANAVCHVLAEYPSIPGLTGVLQGIEDDGFTPRQAGGIVAVAVQASCPRFVPLLEQFVDLYLPASTASVIA